MFYAPGSHGSIGSHASGKRDITAIPKVQQVRQYDIGGSSELVGTTYQYNIWGLYSTSSSQGMFSLVNEMKATASAAGADSISILGTHVVNPSLMTISPATAARVGLSFEAVSDSAILLTGLLP